MGGGVRARTCPGPAGSARHPGVGRGAGGARSPRPRARCAALVKGAQPRPPARWRRLRGGRCAAAGPGARRGRISSARRGRRCDSRLCHLRPPSPPPRHPSLTKPGRSRAKPGPEQRRRGTEGGARWAAGGAGGGGGGGGGGVTQEKAPCFCPGGGPDRRSPPQITAPVHSGQSRIPRIHPLIGSAGKMGMLRRQELRGSTWPSSYMGSFIQSTSSILNNTQ